jgi:hypothetical protein
VRSPISIRISDQINLIKNDWIFTKWLYVQSRLRHKYPCLSKTGMDPVELKTFMERHGYPFGASLTPFSFSRYPPSSGLVFGLPANPAKLKDRMLKENPLFSARLNDFSRMYLRRASELLDIDSSLFPMGHPMRAERAEVLEENDTLRKENLELRKRLEQMSKNKKQH